MPRSKRDSSSPFGSVVIYSGETHSAGTDIFEIVAPRPREDHEKWTTATIEQWNEVKSSLPADAPHARLAGDFVDICQSMGAFIQEPGCAIDLLEDGCIMFDWNDGQKPIFTVMITPEERVIDVGRFDDGKVNGDARTLKLAAMHLELFTLESEIDTWQMQNKMAERIYSFDSSLSVTEPEKVTMRVPAYTPHQEREIFQSSTKMGEGISFVRGTIPESR